MICDREESESTCYELISLFVLGGRDRFPGPAYLLYSVLRYAAVKVPRGGSPGSRMLDFLESCFDSEALILMRISLERR